MANRGCGNARQKAGIYAVCPLSPYGLPLENFLCDPPVLVDVKEIGITPVGVKLVERNGVWHIMDWVGSVHYENISDYIEELRLLGLSRRLPTSLDFKKLTSASRIILLHSRAYIENFQEYQKVEPEKEELEGLTPYPLCMRRLSEHTRPHMETMCSRLWYQDVTGGEKIEVAKDEASASRVRCVTRKMPSFEYHALTAPENVKPQYKVAIFASLPVAGIQVVKDEEAGTHERSLMLAEEARIPVELVDE